LFEAVCRNDLEGIVAKRADARYTPEQPTWVKIKNRNYSQIEGRRKLFEKRRPAER
jgi:ATP-dependent DNA ligase